MTPTPTRPAATSVVARRHDTVTVEVPAEVRATVAECVAERDAGMALAESGDRFDWNKRLIAQAIDAFAGTGLQFSANDIRVVLPSDVPTAMIGGQFTAALNSNRIRFVGLVRSSKRNTHNKRINAYVGHILGGTR